LWTGTKDALIGEYAAAVVAQRVAHVQAISTSDKLCLEKKGAFTDLIAITMAQGTPINFTGEVNMKTHA
jgi:hypothetical protein